MSKSSVEINSFIGSTVKETSAQLAANNSLACGVVIGNAYITARSNIAELAVAAYISAVNAVIASYKHVVITCRACKSAARGVNGYSFFRNSSFFILGSLFCIFFINIFFGYGLFCIFCFGISVFPDCFFGNCNFIIFGNSSILGHSFG